MLGRMSKLLDQHPKLVDKFSQLLPPDMPLSHFNQPAVEVVVGIVCYTYFDVLYIFGYTFFLLSVSILHVF